MTEVFTVHCIRTDTCKEGDGAPIKIFSNKDAAVQFCTKNNTQNVLDCSMFFVVRIYAVETTYSLPEN